MTTTPAGYQLTRADMAILEFARATWKYAGVAEGIILTRFGYTAARYHQRLNWILDQADAAAYDPQLVAREHRLREHRQRARGARQPRFDQAGTR